jgi:hypothetical protein
MSDVAEASSRYALPFLVVAQAGKEQTHNEAIALIDMLLQPQALAVRGAPPPDPQGGESWIVAPGATGAWSGRDGAIAGWTDGGWRFAEVPVGFEMTVGDLNFIRKTEGWAGPRQVVTPEGGAIVDAEARAAILQLIELFRDRGVVAP